MSSSAVSQVQMEPLMSKTGKDETVIRAQSQNPSTGGDDSSKSKLKPARKIIFLAGCALVILSIAVVNIIFLLWVVIHGEVLDGFRVVAHTQCSNTENIASGIHVVINVFSTAILAASNYCMQCLAAPTRTEVNRAHAKGRYLDIGVQSVRNLWFISKWRVAIWCILALTSVPVHLMYNSSIFAQLSATDYEVFVTNEAFYAEFLARPLNGTLTTPKTDAPTSSPLGIQTLHTNYNESYDKWHLLPFRMRTMQNLSASECINVYSNNLVDSYRDVILISQDYQNKSIEWLDSTSPPNHNWVCGDPFSDLSTDEFMGYDLHCLKSMVNPSNWTFETASQKIDYCMAEPIESYCSVRLSLANLGYVIGAGLLKFACIIYVIFRIPIRPAMTTTGDAIASFLHNPDSLTAERCTWNASDFGKKSFLASPQPRVLLASQRRFMIRSVSWDRLLLCGVVWGGFLVVYLEYFIILIFDTDHVSFHHLLQVMGWGSSGTALASNLSFENSLLTTNSPQIALSLLYISANAIITTIYANIEWFRYSRVHQVLRVSDPTANQNSTRFLTLPWKWSLSLMISSTLLHWLGSQAFSSRFVYHFDLQGYLVIDSTDTIFGSGAVSVGSLTGQMLSPIACLTLLCVSTLLFLGLIVLSFQRFQSTRMPLGATSSAVLSAACHPHFLEVDPQLYAVRWGEVDIEAERDEPSDAVKHLTFTSMRVKEPTVGALYA